MAYTKTNWQDLPNTTTPINATNLNKIENELATLDANTSTISYNQSTGSLVIGANNGDVVLRPNGTNSSSGQASLETNGNLVLNGEIVPKTTITLGNEWIMGYKASGDNLSVIIPFTNPLKKAVLVNITSAEVYAGGWQSITYGGITVLQTFVKLGFSTSASLTNGYVYLVKITGTISI